MRHTSFKDISRNTISEQARRELKAPLSLPAASYCICREDDGCAESCHNREMAYDCDETNCRIGGHCTNRLTTQDQPKCSVLQAGDKGYGLFADEPIRQGRVVAQYTGKVITMSEVRDRYESKYSDLEVSLHLP